MTADHVDATIRRAIGGDRVAIDELIGAARESDDARVLTMAALLGGDASGLDRARDAARTSRTRQIVAIARAHLRGDRELVDALARDHLVDFPDSLIVAWVAGGPG